ncbi:peptidoglycan hydrolase CwlO-like protein [Evansella vedderi]|uniref:Peptidoglycan hydrolase CwlO-like protein n=1 Tax=Evansella vedderi TaxID=38282 RepID=A0ABT9ZV16_9BACI|nr:peptidoglycan DD-metalloendopeptidase family protein [Evansella vedderi]MDQ0254561.1 peptidoglycan hydrolase CwlO-like protein [Evansella vedderi]
MDRRIILVCLALLLTFSTFIGTNPFSVAEANTGEELKEEIRSNQEQQGELEGEAEETHEQIQKVESEIQEAAAEIRRLDEETARTNAAIDEQQDEIDGTKERIDILHEEIIELEERIAQRDELLKDRVRHMYQNGGVINFIEVVLGAQNFGDLIERISALNTIAVQDRNILEQHIADKEALEIAKEQLEIELTSLEEQMAELEALRAQLDEQRQEKDRLLQQLEERQISLEDYLVSIEEEQAILRAQEAAVKAELERWEEEQRRLEEERKRQEEERKRQEEEERKRQEEAARASSGSNSNNNNSSPSSTQSTQATAPTDNGSGILMRPATGRITSGYGMRWGRMHHGIDIGQGGRSNVPIVAAESGTVTFAGWMNGYGNTILITHVIEGRQITTLYAHLDSFNVSNGNRVNRGQQIGIMGNTGQSTGPHLHFEVHEGDWNGAKSNSVDPMNYIN